MNPRLSLLQAYPFERLTKLMAGAVPPAHLLPISLSIGEPQHAPPQVVLDSLIRGSTLLGSYPSTQGTADLRTSITSWLERRFSLKPGAVDPSAMVLPVNGTREALFAFVQVAIDASNTGEGSRAGAAKSGNKAGAPPLVIMPNPFYQIYEGAALLAGATPYYLNLTQENDFAPDLEQIPKEVLERTQVLFLCNPGNPTGRVLSRAYLAKALDLADKYDFLVACDECYAEIYPDEANPPPSLLEVALETGRDRFERCIVFHSLSKRSSVPGLRSGFVAGDPQVMRKFLLYRTYQGGAMSPMVQLASAAAWNDDAHVHANRQLYREKFERLPILQTRLEGGMPWLSVVRPEGGFYLWVDVDGDDERFTRELFVSQNVKILPGSYLARNTPDGNPGARHVRLSLTASVEDCVTAALRIREFVQSGQA